MKKILSVVLAVIMLLTMSVTAFAAELTSTDKSGVDSQLFVEAIPTEDIKELSSEEYAQILSTVSRRAKNAITPELVEQVRVLRQEIESSEVMQEIQNNAATRATYDSVTLEALLCTNDGLSLLDIFAIGFTHANAARDEAIDLYEDQGKTVEMKRDAFRHMTWNFRSLKDVGESKTRIATINHEWAYVILPAVTQYEEEQFDYYFDLYYNQIMWGLITVTDINNMAKAAADAYAIAYRDELIEECKDSLSVFNATFENSSIMDFWNNKVGRDYAKSHPNSTTDEVFTLAWNANKLIKHEGSTAVTSSKRSTLHSTNWWYIS